MLETPLHPQKLVVWFELSSGDITKPCRVENENEDVLSVIGDDTET